MKSILYVSSALILVACGTKVEEEIFEIPVGESEVVEVEETDEWIDPEIPEARPVYRPSETILTDLIHTKLEVDFIWEKSQMNGVATITAKPHFYETDSLILDAKGMEIHSVKMDGKDLNFTYIDDYIRINLGKKYTRKDNYTVVIDYLAKPEEREEGGSAAISSDKGLYFINPTGEDRSKMPQIWTQGETEASSVWFPTIDSPNAKTTQEIFITVDEKYRTLSNGELISSIKKPGRKRTDHWKQDLPHPPYLFMMGVGEFKVVRDSYTRPDGSQMDVHYYVEPEWEDYAKAIFGETPTMIKFFSELTGVEYPWDKYHQIVVRDYVSGAMENTGAVIFGDYVYKNDRELLDENDQSTIAHELFHHWFGDLVTCESWSNLPLNESFANYSQYLWDEYRYGVDEADYFAEVEKDGYFQSAQFQGHHDLIWFDYDDKEQMFDGHSYNKGGRILHMLRNYLGDEAFFEGLRNYLEANKFKPAEFHQLRLAFEEVSGEDMNWFFNQWFLGSGHPRLEFEQSVSEGELTVTVHQNQNLELSPIYKIPMEIAIHDDNGKSVHKILVDKLEEEFTFPISGEVKGILYDHQEMLLCNKNEDKTLDQYIFQYYNSDRYMTRSVGLKKGGKARNDRGQQLILDAMDDEFWGIREEAVDMTNKLKDDFRVKGIEKLKDLAKNDPKSAVRLAALEKLGKLIDDWSKLESNYVAIVETDSSYSVITGALAGIGQENPEKALELAAGLESERSSTMLSGIAQIYAGHGEADKYEFFERILMGNVLQGFDVLGASSAFTYFVSRQDPELIGKSIPVYEHLSEGGGYYMSMFLPQNLSYLKKGIGKMQSELDDKIAMHEENGDALYADQARKKIKDYDVVADKIEEFINRLNAENGDNQLMFGGEEDDE